MPKLQSAGVQVEAVTAEPGGDDTVKSRLEERGVSGLTFQVKSDPDHKLLAPEAGDIYVVSPFEIELTGPYQMIQPALVVFDSGKLIPECTWSWKTMGYGDKTEMDTVFDESVNAQVALVTYRPVMSDLLLSIQEHRPIKLATTHKNVADILG